MILCHLEIHFTGISDISVQLNLALAMDRCDIAKSAIFVENRRKELKVLQKKKKKNHLRVGLFNKDLHNRFDIGWTLYF